MTALFRVGIIGWNALPVLVPGANPATGFGGMETAVVDLARSLADRDDLDVTLFVRADTARSPDGEPWPEMIGALRLSVHVDRFRVVRQQVSQCIDVPRRRLRRWRWRLLWQCPLLAFTRPFRRREPNEPQPDRRLRSHAADAWLTFGDGLESLQIILAANQHHVPAFLWLRSNAGLTPQAAEDESYINQVGEQSAIQQRCWMQATDVFCQTQWQRERLRSMTGRDGVWLPNSIDDTGWRPARHKTSDAAVFWIGRADDFHKRPRLLLQIAERCPEIPFRMILNPFDDWVEAEIRQHAPPNVRIIDRVAFHRMVEQYRSAKLLVSTGHPDHEGFPNVLLQAAASHTPIVSMHDFDDFVVQSGAGVIGGESIETMATLVRQYASAPQIDWRRVDAYLQEHHDPETIQTRLVHRLKRGDRSL